MSDYRIEVRIPGFPAPCTIVVHGARNEKAAEQVAKDLIMEAIERIEFSIREVPPVKFGDEEETPL